MTPQWYPTSTGRQVNTNNNNSCKREREREKKELSALHLRSTISTHHSEFYFFFFPPPFPSQLWPNGRYGANYSSTKLPYLDSTIMRWVQAPIASAAYTIRSADGAAASDPTSYTPDVPLTIHLRVSDLKMRFIGLVLYATNNR